MLFRKGSRRRTALMITLGVALLVAGLVVFNRNQPALEGVSPTPGAENVPSRTALQLLFSRPMQPESVRASLSTQPETVLEMTWDESATTFTFTPVGAWSHGETITATLTTGARSSQGLPLVSARSWTFIVARTALAYLWPSEGPADIYLLDPDSGSTTQLTQSSLYGVKDFSLSQDGTTIYYSEGNASSGSDLKRLDRLTGETTILLACGEDLCQSPQISPDDHLLSYQRASGTESQIWLLDLTDETTISLGGTQMPAWSFTGLLAYHDTDREAYLIYDPTTKERISFENQTGEPGSWSPDGAHFVAPEILTIAEDTTPGSHLIRFDLATRSTTDLTRASNIEDSSPAHAPDGETIAYARKFLDAARWTPGRQLWLVDSDGLAAQPLTDDSAYNHHSFTWHPNGEQIAYVRSNQATLDEPSEIWLIHTDGSEPLRLVIGGYSPRWVP